MTPQISLIYKIYFLYFEPLAAFLGAIGGFTNPTQILTGITPASLSPLASLPLTRLSKLLTEELCSSYILFARNQAIVLRCTNGLKIWRLLIFGMVLSDIGHIYALYSADPGAFVDVTGWRGSDWVNEGTLLLGMALRIGFLMGFGVRRR